MFFREYHHAGRDELWGIWCYPTAHVTHAGRGMTAFDFTLLNFSTIHTWPPRPLEDADREIQSREADGFRETPRSLSRRWFEQPSPLPAKFWIIERDGRLVGVHFGRIPKNLHHGYHGRRQAKKFPTAEKALAYYTKMIREKSDAGYREVSPRPQPG